MQTGAIEAEYVVEPLEDPVPDDHEERANVEDRELVETSA